MVKQNESIRPYNIRCTLDSKGELLDLALGTEMPLLYFRKDEGEARTTREAIQFARENAPQITPLLLFCHALGVKGLESFQWSDTSIDEQNA